jgi:hypothetical protein
MLAIMGYEINAISSKSSSSFEGLLVAHFVWVMDETAIGYAFTNHWSLREQERLETARDFPAHLPWPGMSDSTTWMITLGGVVDCPSKTSRIGFPIKMRRRQTHPLGLSVHQRLKAH